MSATRQLHLGVSLDGAGTDPAAWREPEARAQRLFTADHIVELVQLAERGTLDFVTLSDSFALQPGGAGRVRGQLDALLTLARVAPVTSSIGLVPTVTTTHTEPFHISKNIATLDLVSGGRAGWLVDVSTDEAEARHFGRRQVADERDLYAEASEAVDVVGRLWDSWEDDAVIRDVPTGRYLDRDKVHYVDFEGRFFSVRGPSITPRSPQAQPPIAVHASSPSALDVAARWADVVLIDAASLAEAVDARAFVDDAVRGAGRDPSSVTLLAVVDVLLGSTLDEAAAPKDVADVFEEWFEAGAVDGFVMRPALLPTTLRAIVDDVVPDLRRRGLFRTAYAESTLRARFGLDRPANRYAAGGVSR